MRSPLERRRPPIGKLGRLRVLLLGIFAAALHAGELKVTPFPLPALSIDGVAARAHIQGLEVVGQDFYVTARRDDVNPKRALLLRTSRERSNWDVWDITPKSTNAEISLLNHPGGMQSDGKRLWIPVAESRRHGRSVVRIFRLAALSVGKPAEPEFEFSVDDHIGAIAVSRDDKVALGANWDTESVYVWNLNGKLQRTLGGQELELRGLGAAAGLGGRAGLTVQDWKWMGRELCANGLFRDPNQSIVDRTVPASRWMRFGHFLDHQFSRSSVELPWAPRRIDVTIEGGSSTGDSPSDAATRRRMESKIELGNEAMAADGKWVYFLPEDLGASNRIFRVSRRKLMGSARSSGFSQ